MGSVRGVLPRLAVLGLAGAAFVVLLIVSRADAAVAGPEPDPVGALDEAIAAALPAGTSEVPTPLVLGGTQAPPTVADPEPTLSTDLAPELAGTEMLLAGPAPTIPNGAIEGGHTSPLPPPLVAATSDSAPASQSLPGLTEVAIPLADEVPRTAIALPSFPALAFEPDTVDHVDEVDEVDVPAALLSLPDGASLPIPLPSPHPGDQEDTFLRPATAPTIAANPSARQAVGPSVEAIPSYGPPTGTLATRGEPIPPDPGAGSGPARAPPEDAPSDPPHRGSTDHASHEYSALPGTDRIGDTRGESWHAGTDAEMSNTPPEPSVSPD